MKRHALAIALFALATPAFAQESAPVEPVAPADTRIEGVAAIVNDEPISYFDVRERARLLLLGLQSQPDQATLQRITGQAREQLIDERLQLQKAKEFELVVAEEDIQRRMAQMAESSGASVEALYNDLTRSGVNPRSLEEQIRADIAWNRIMSGLYGRNIRISETQIEDRLEQIRTSAGKTQFRLGEIFLYAPDAERREQALGLANTLIEQFNQGAPFEMGAQRFSASATAATGGDMGWVTLDEIPEEARAGIEALGGPGIAPPVATTSGVYIYAVRGRQDAQDGGTLTDIRQLVARDGSREALDAAIAGGANCSNLIETAAADDNLSAIEIGFVDPATLNAETQARIAETAEGTASEPFAVRNGLAVTFVCGSRAGSVDLPSREQIENQLYSQQLSMISDRELRNLKREALIIRP